MVKQALGLCRQLFIYSAIIKMMILINVRKCNTMLHIVRPTNTLMIFESGVQLIYIRN